MTTLAPNKIMHSGYARGAERSYDMPSDTSTRPWGLTFAEPVPELNSEDVPVTYLDAGKQVSYTSDGDLLITGIRINDGGSWGVEDTRNDNQGETDTVEVD